MKKTPLVTETDGAVAASSIPMPLNGDYSLYFHVPFCTRKCDYCHFYVVPDQPRFKEIYMRALKKEWEMRQPFLPKTAPVSIYFGGGTPSLLGSEAIAQILSWIQPSPACEITLEVNPENVTHELMSAYYRCGINRISLGIQTFDAPLLTLLSRTHTAQKGKLAVEKTYQAGFRNISIDLMYDLPDQTLQSWHETLTSALSLPITHLSLYNLTIEPHTVFYKKKKTLNLPKEEESFAMHTLAMDALKEAGWRRYEISAFAKTGSYSRHNTGYWTGRSFLGFGPSAFSYWEGERFRNIAHLNHYSKKLENNQDPIDFREKLPEKEKWKEALAIGLRLIEGIEFFSFPPEMDLCLAALEKEGFVSREAQKIRLTENGLLFHDSVAEKIINF